MDFSKDNLFFTTLFDSAGSDNVRNDCYRDIILHTLKRVLPNAFFHQKGSDQATREHQRQFLGKALPLVTHSSEISAPGTHSFFLLSRYHSSSFKFFFEMISRWLTPGRRLNVVLVYAADFRLTDQNEELYTLCEIMINVADQEELEKINKNFPHIKTEIALGVQSDFSAYRILEVKGVPIDDKVSRVQKSITFLVKRFPIHYDSDLFTEMQHVMAICPDDFKGKRQARHLSRIICIQYLLRRALREAINKKPNKRHFYLKAFRAAIREGEGKKKVLGILVGMSFIREQENLREGSLIKAIQHSIPSALPVKDSFLTHKLSSEHISSSYIEVEKQDDSLFTPVEIRKLKRELPSNLKSRIEHRLHTVFMPRNEEEVMRTVLALTNQIKYVRDIPQVAITFEEQAPSHLYFTVILARLLKPGSLTMAELFNRSGSSVMYLPDRTKLMGYLRKKYPKEASIFRLKLPKDEFLRPDHSIDLYKARQAVVKELLLAFGEIRDFNGGMISKQHELLTNIRALLSDMKDCDEMLLENFFYSLSPVVARALLDPHAFKTLFLMLLEGIREYKSEEIYLKFHEEKEHFLILTLVEDLLLKDEIGRVFQSLHLPAVEFASASMKSHSFFCLGFIYSSQDQVKREQLREAITQTTFLHRLPVIH